MPSQGITLGIPRVLFFWDSMPFWKTLLQALGFTVKLSHKSTRAIYENGLSAVTSDTVCFPAKLVHGHLRDLHKQGVDRIFMPIVTTVPSENTSKDSQSMCAVVKGYALVVQNSYAMGYLGVEKAWQVLQGEKFDSTALIDTATTIVTDVVICSTRARIA